MIRRPPRSTPFSLNDALPISPQIASNKDLVNAWYHQRRLGEGGCVFSIYRDDPRAARFPRELARCRRAAQRAEIDQLSDRGSHCRSLVSLFRGRGRTCATERHQCHYGYYQLISRRRHKTLPSSAVTLAAYESAVTVGLNRAV